MKCDFTVTSVIILGNLIMTKNMSVRVICQILYTFRNIYIGTVGHTSVSCWYSGPDCCLSGIVLYMYHSKLVCKGDSFNQSTSKAVQIKNNVWFKRLVFLFYDSNKT